MDPMRPIVTAGDYPTHVGDPTADLCQHVDNRAPSLGIRDVGLTRSRRQLRDSRMPRFHFNIHDGKSILDEEGTVLPDWQTARIEAVRLAGRILQDEAQSIALGEDWRIEVTDDAGLILFQMTFLVVEAPVLLDQIAHDAARNQD